MTAPAGELLACPMLVSLHKILEAQIVERWLTCEHRSGLLIGAVSVPTIGESGNLFSAGLIPAVPMGGHTYSALAAERWAAPETYALRDQEMPGMIFRYSSSVKARRVSMRIPPFDARERLTRA